MRFFPASQAVRAKGACRLFTARVRQQAARRAGGPGHEIGPRLRLLDPKQPVAAALFRRLDDRPPQPGERLFDGLGDPSLRPQRHDARDAQLDRLLDEPLLPVALGQRHAKR